MKIHEKTTPRRGKLKNKKNFHALLVIDSMNEWINMTIGDYVTKAINTFHHYYFCIEIQITFVFFPHSLSQTLFCKCSTSVKGQMISLQHRGHHHHHHHNGEEKLGLLCVCVLAIQKL